MVEEEITILVSVLVLILLTVIFVVIFVVFVRRKNKLLQEQENIKIKFNTELAKAQIEIRETTLKNISWELHDNIGQLMTLAKIHAQESLKYPDKIDDVIDILDKGIKELRALSRVINPESIRRLSLIEAIKIEIERFNRLEFIEAHLNIDGDIIEIDRESETIIFRILQEIFANTIKHSKGKNLWVNLSFFENVLEIEVKDDGIGFKTEKDYEGIGIKNIISRAKIIDLDLKISSELTKGTQFILVYSIH